MEWEGMGKDQNDRMGRDGKERGVMGKKLQDGKVWEMNDRTGKEWEVGKGWEGMGRDDKEWERMERDRKWMRREGMWKDVNEWDGKGCEGMGKDVNECEDGMGRDGKGCEWMRGWYGKGWERMWMNERMAWEGIVKDVNEWEDGMGRDGKGCEWMRGWHGKGWERNERISVVLRILSWEIWVWSRVYIFFS